MSSSRRQRQGATRVAVKGLHNRHEKASGAAEIAPRWGGGQSRVGGSCLPAWASRSILRVGSKKLPAWRAWLQTSRTLAAMSAPATSAPGQDGGIVGGSSAANPRGYADRVLRRHARGATRGIGQRPSMCSEAARRALRGGRRAEDREGKTLVARCRRTSMASVARLHLIRSRIQGRFHAEWMRPNPQWMASMSGSYPWFKEHRPRSEPTTRATSLRNNNEFGFATCATTCHHWRKGSAAQTSRS